MPTKPEEAQVIDKSAYTRGVANMEPGQNWPMVFVSDGRKKKKPELLCAVLSMPEWYELLSELYSLRRENKLLRGAALKSKTAIDRALKQTTS